MGVSWIRFAVSELNRWIKISVSAVSPKHLKYMNFFGNNLIL